MEKEETRDKVVVEGELFVLVEETLDGEDVDICAEVSGINIWDWLRMHDKEKVRITLEKL